MSFFRFEDFETKPTKDRSAYMRQYYLKYKKKSIRKRPIMTEEERREAQKQYSKRHSEKKKLLKQVS